MNLGHVLFSPNGRIGQQDFWIGILILIGGNILVNALPVIGGILWLGLIWVGIAIYGKRLHDAGKTAWLHVIPWALSFLFAIIGATIIVGGAVSAGLIADADDLSAQQIIALIFSGGLGLLFISLSVLVWLVYTIWVGVMKGDAGDNAYGSPPGADAATAANVAAASSAAGAPPASEAAAPSTPPAPASPADPAAPAEAPADPSAEPGGEASEKPGDDQPKTT
jgi:uncharacterized membrane protein YhaH (DUF805 family)